MRALLISCAVVATACGGSSSSAPDAAIVGDGAGGDGVGVDAAIATATVRVHYPAGHAVTIRGSGGGLSWTAGAATTGAGGVFTYTTAALTAPIEWKPLLDDATWARGPNYHLAPGASIDVWPHFTTTAGKVVTQIATFHSATLANDRAIYAYLPPSYDENPGARFPVVYMHDGQNLWAALPQLAFGAPWNVDATFDAAAESGACSSATLAGWGAQPLGAAATTCTGDGDCGPGGRCETFPEAIVIGVANTSGRFFEYTPVTDPNYPGGGGADQYLTMLVTELKPVIDAQLRTRPEAASTSLAGSSLGGLVTAYAGRKYPQVFSRLGVVSPSTFWGNNYIVGQIQSTPAGARPTIVYVDSGAGSGDDQADTDLLAAAYVGVGYVEGVNFRHVVQAGATHSEVYWAQRLPGALQLMLGVR